MVHWASFLEWVGNLRNKPIQRTETKTNGRKCVFNAEEALTYYVADLYINS